MLNENVKKILEEIEKLKKENAQLKQVQGHQ
jgi:hypothetical protein